MGTQSHTLGAYQGRGQCSCTWPPSAAPERFSIYKGQPYAVCVWGWNFKETLEGDKLDNNEKLECPVQMALISVLGCT